MLETSASSANRPSPHSLVINLLQNGMHVLRVSQVTRDERHAAMLIAIPCVSVQAMIGLPDAHNVS